MRGVLVVDKPAGMTSHDVVARVRRALGPSAQRRRGKVKVGHAGTLDPDATGVLVVCVGVATKLVPWLQASRKTYEARLRLGVVTDTLDASGTVLSRTDPSAVSERQLCDALQAFVGEIWQIPPMVSAVRVGGERLYEKARRGEEVERERRCVQVDALVLEDFSPGPEASAAFFVTCSTGTYVRTLAADIGQWLGVGAHLESLRRLGSGRFSVEDAVGLDTLTELAAEGRLAEVLLPMAEAVRDYPTLVVGPDDARALGHGQWLPVTGHDGPVAAVDEAGRLLAMVADRDGHARPLAVFPAEAADGRGQPQPERPG